MTGRGTSGSWEIRGRQLGHAIGADVLPDASHVDGYDVAVLVKRSRGNLVDRLHAAGVPVVWDVVDAWPQPAGNDWDRGQCIEWLQARVQAIRPAGIVAATRAMADDCAQFGVPVLWLPHHGRPEQSVNPIRESVKVVGYEGGEAYLGRWRRVLERECAARGWRFCVNPARLADLDIVVALREASGYAPRQWKSNVKLANAQATGTPVLCNREAGYTETASGAELWVDAPEHVGQAFNALAAQESRLAAHSRLLKATRTLEATAKEYRTWLQSNF